MGYLLHVLVGDEVHEGEPEEFDVKLLEELGILILRIGSVSRIINLNRFRIKTLNNLHPLTLGMS